MFEPCWSQDGKESLLTEKKKIRSTKKETKSAKNETRSVQNEIKYAQNETKYAQIETKSLQNETISKHENDFSLLVLMAVHGRCGHNVDGGCHLPYVDDGNQRMTVLLDGCMAAITFRTKIMMTKLCFLFWGFQINLNLICCCLGFGSVCRYDGGCKREERQRIIRDS